jgi:hypothetical protein
MASFIIPERPIPIIGQTTTVDISPGTKYGHKSDGAVITTTMIVENPEPNDLSVPFSLLTADPDENRPPIPKVRIKKEVREMGSADYDQEQMVKAAMELAAQQGGDPEQTRQSLTTLLAAIDKPRRLKTYITLKPNEKMLLQFTHRQRITPAADGTMHFKDLAPLPQYCIKTGGSIHYAVALPRPLDGLNPQLVPELCQPAGWTQAPMGERMWLWWRWQNDPLLEVVYRY